MNPLTKLFNRHQHTWKVISSSQRNERFVSGSIFYSEEYMIRRTYIVSQCAECGEIKQQVVEGLHNIQPDAQEAA